MSVYGINKLFYRLEQDPALRERFRADPDAAFAGFPLSAEEARAIKAGDVGRLYEWGAHAFLLLHYVRHGLCGLDRPTYLRRIRGEAPPGD